MFFSWLLGFIFLFVFGFESPWGWGQGHGQGELELATQILHLEFASFKLPPQVSSGLKHANRGAASLCSASSTVDRAPCVCDTQKHKCMVRQTLELESTGMCISALLFDTNYTFSSFELVDSNHCIFILR